MEELLGYCGFKCDICPAYEKNQDQNTDRQLISDKWFQYFGFRVAPEILSCAGCKNEGRHLDTDCPVRPCAIDRKLENCAYCESYGCEALKTRINFVESNGINIENIPEDDYKNFIEPYLGSKRLEAIREKK
ncbi:MAG: DUF3795 domain-containing protein [Spirochaetes bacterium]|nr:DUF3795 domain-containing protein [Spirochaetota bacterium]